MIQYLDLTVFTNYAMSFSIKTNNFAIIIYLSVESIILKHEMLRAICINPVLSRICPVYVDQPNYAKSMIYCNQIVLYQVNISLRYTKFLRGSATSGAEGLFTCVSVI